MPIPAGPDAGTGSGAPCVSPCGSWVTAAELTARCPTVTGQIATDAALAATEILFEMSAQRFVGSCAERVRPCRLSCTEGKPCGCARLSEVDLGIWPLTGVTEVKVDGVVLDPTAYRVDDYRWLVRIDGDTWPSCQNLALADTADDTFAVTITYGQAPPQAGIEAARALGCQLGRARVSGSCDLPARATSVTRQGVTIDASSVAESLREGLTGIPEVDLFLHAYNPKGVQRVAEIVDLHALARVRRVGT